MTNQMPDQYRELVLQSSNLLLEGDLSRVLGCYEEAALKRFKAGEQRKQMGTIAARIGKPVFAFEDWLSASACYLEATAVKEAVDVLAQLTDMEKQGAILPNRRDLFDALTERRAELTKLKDTVERFESLFHKYTERHGLASPNDGFREFLLHWRRELPGFFYLHYALACQAEARGETEKVREHLKWAREFCIEDAHGVAFIGYAFITLGEWKSAYEMAEAFLPSDESESAPVRLMMATSMLGQAASEPGKATRALELLQPVIQAEGIETRIPALVLSVLLYRELGQWSECQRLEQELQSLEKDGSIPPNGLVLLSAFHDKLSAIGSQTANVTDQHIHATNGTRMNDEVLLLLGDTAVQPLSEIKNLNGAPTFDALKTRGRLLKQAA